MTKEGEWGKLGNLFTQEHLQALSVVGTPYEVGEELAERFGRTADRIALSIPQGIDPSWLTDLVRGVKNS